jgi:UPF0042 nucleotide-binding protein
MSFGYKHGVPPDADLVWDVRFLPNPNYLPRLRNRTGQDPTVARFALDNPVARQFLTHAESFLDFLLERFVQEGKSYVTLAIGCTGGHHRSVAVSEALGAFIRRKRRFDVRVQHRDAAR